MPEPAEPDEIPAPAARAGRLAAWWQRLPPKGLLERRMLGVALAGLLPLALLSSFTLLQSTHSHKERLIESAQDTMRAVITAVDSELNLSIATLEALAAAPSLARRDMGAFQAEARELLGLRENWANIALSDRHAQLMNAQLPTGSVLPGRGDTESIEEVFRTGLPVIGNVRQSPVLKTPVFGVFIPVRRGGEVAYVLSAQVRPGSIRDVVSQQGVPTDGVVAIVDRHHHIVARSRRHDEAVGKLAAPQLVEFLRQRAGGRAITHTLEGTPVYTATHRSSSTGWAAAIGIPTAALDGPVQRSFAVLLAAILVSVAAGLAAAFAMSRKIVGPMRELELAAIAVGHGHAPTTMPHTDLPEIQRAARALEAARVAQDALLDSQRRAMEVERHARLMAEEANQAKDQLLAMLGHELRNPLAAITAASQVLERLKRSDPATDPSAGERNERAKEVIGRQARHLGRITDDLLNAGGIMTGKVQLARKPLELAGVVRNVVNALPAERLAGRQLKVDLASAWVEADVSRIEQVVNNLLNNALKYTPAPGIVEITLRTEGDEAVLSVNDSGVGIEAELLPRVFDLFVQGPRSLDRAEGGMGIGLAIVRRLTELHGGRVEGRSAGPGRGSTFTVFLPRIEAPAAAAASRGAAAPAVPRRIVVVEDIDEVRQMLREWLQIEGHEVIEAADGPSGIEAVLRERPDVALVDIGLPLADGYAVARAVRAQLGDTVWLVAMSGYGQQEDKARGLQAGFDAYLVKPVEPQVLSDLLAHKTPMPAVKP